MAEPGDEHKDIVQRQVFQRTENATTYVSPYTHTIDWDKVENFEDIKKILIEICNEDFYINPAQTTLDAKYLKKADIKLEDKYPLPSPVLNDDKSEGSYE